MSYPLIGLNHQILGIDHCSGYKDITGNWNTGFFCPKGQFNESVFCCGTLTYKYCCIQQLQTELNTSKFNNDTGPVNLHRSPITIGLAATGATLFLSVLIYITCYFCSCCYYYRKRPEQNPEDYYDEPTFPVSSSSCEGILNPFHPLGSFDLRYQNGGSVNNNSNIIIDPHHQHQRAQPNQSISLSTINTNNNNYSYPYNSRLFTISGNSDPSMSMSSLSTIESNPHNNNSGQVQPKPVSFVNIRNNVAYITSVMPLFGNPKNNNSSQPTTFPSQSSRETNGNNIPLLSPRRNYERISKIEKRKREVSICNNSGDEVPEPPPVPPQVLLRNPTSPSTLLSPSSNSSVSSDRDPKSQCSVSTDENTRDSGVSVNMV